MIATPHKKLPAAAFFGKSDVGLRRANNEDAFIVKPELGVCLAADGMGGAAAGELASRILSKTALQVFSTTKDRSEKETIRLVRQSFTLANARILNYVKTHPHHKGMGCTAEVVAFSDEGFVLGHIGDSRTYRFRNGQLKQLTKDHSLVQNHINRGIISPAEARNNPLRNVIFRAVGVKEKFAPDFMRGTAACGDIFLLCTDGLTDMVDDMLVQEVLSWKIALSKKGEKLIQLARLAGGLDNITVVLSEVICDK